MNAPRTQPLYSPYRSEIVAAGAQAVNRSSVAALTFLVWDMLITFKDEVRYIWPAPWSYTKCAYFVARYLPAMVQISTLFVGTELTPHFHFTPHDCYIWQIYQGVAATIICLTVDIILILRTFALYHDNSVVRFVVGVCYVLETVGMAIGLALALPKIETDNLCTVVSIPDSILVYGASYIIFQFLLFSLMIYKFFQAARMGWGNVPLLTLLVRDGTWAFILVFVALLGQISMAALPKDKLSYSAVLFGWMLTILSFCGYRILLNFKRFSERRNDPGTKFEAIIMFENAACSSETTMDPC